jgi:threonine/homoserine/homoserine lactone efflux protein
MPSTSTLTAFAVAAFPLVALPGPNMLYLLGRSISEGRRAGVLSALGTETGTLIQITAAAAGLSALLASSATAFAFVKYAGAAYLVYLPQFVDPDEPAASQIVVLGLILGAIGLVIGIATALAAGSMARRVRTRRGGGRPWSRWASGCLYLALGAYAALSPAHRTR